MTAVVCVPGHSGLLPLLLLAVAKSMSVQVRTKSQVKEAFALDLHQALQNSASVVRTWRGGFVARVIAGVFVCVCVCVCVTVCLSICLSVCVCRERERERERESCMERENI